jgi:hypothetical protein
VGEIISTATVKVEQPEAGAHDSDQPTTSVLDSNRHDNNHDHDQSGDVDPTMGPRLTRKASLLHASRTTSFSAGPSKLSNVYTHPQSQLDPSMLSTAPSRIPKSSGSGGDANDTNPKFFHGLRISHLIEEAYEGLQSALLAHGAELVSEEERLDGKEVDYVVVRL